MKYYPFERNNYYIGKILNVSCFEVEQKYASDKRRFLNRFVSGFGVVCGLDTVIVSDDSISVEVGAAIDGAGREIIVSKPDVKKLSSLMGYDPSKSSGEYFLYIQYDEHSSGEVKISRSGASEYERVNERYLLYLSDKPSEQRTGNILYYYKHYRTIFKNDNIEVVMCLPKYLKAKEKFLIDIKIIYKDIEADVKLDMKMELKCIRYNGMDHIDIEFDSRSARDVDGEYTISYICDAMNVVLDMAELNLSCENFALQYNDKEYGISEDISIESVMTDRECEDSGTQNYRIRVMNDISNGSAIDVCISKITVESGKIARVIGFPLEQKLYTNAHLALENAVLKDKVRILSKLYSNGKQEESEPEVTKNDLEISSGEAVINLGIGGNVGKRFFSEEISHGLGLGNVSIVIGLKDGYSEDECVIYGSSEIFGEENKSVKAETAVKLNPAKGTFVVGLRLLEMTSEYEAVVHWTAMRKKEKYNYENDRKIIIDCGTKSLNIMESAYFTVKFVNMPQTDIRWSVENENGGTINDNGCYTAPNHAGIFRISAVCADDSSISATAYIVVKP